MTALAWPKSALPYQSVMFARKSLSRSGGNTITGLEQVIQSSSDYWTATIGFRIRNGAQILAFRAIQAQQWGRAAEWIVPACPQPGVPPSPPPADYSWSDDWSEDFSIGPAPTIIPPGEGALVTTLAARGARSIMFEFIDPSFIPKPGMYFSIGDRLYCIGTVGGAGSIRRYTATFSPGLRVAAAVDDAVEFSNPRCLMRLASDNEGQLDLDQLRTSEQRINFVEIV
jgi:hypothetical protein